MNPCKGLIAKSDNVSSVLHCFTFNLLRAIRDRTEYCPTPWMAFGAGHTIWWLLWMPLWRQGVHLCIEEGWFTCFRTILPWCYPIIEHYCCVGARKAGEGLNLLKQQISLLKLLLISFTLAINVSQHQWPTRVCRSTGSMCRLKSHIQSVQGPVLLCLSVWVLYVSC